MIRILKGVGIMFFWWFILCCDLIIPVLMSAAGYAMWKHPPKDINELIGYRTALSMKNADTWHFANTYCGRLWFKTGIISAVPVAVLHLPFYYSSDDVIGIAAIVICTVMCGVMVATICITEKALHNNFTDDGIRKLG